MHADILNGLVTQDIEIAINLTRIFSDGPFCNLEKKKKKKIKKEKKYGTKRPRRDPIVAEPRNDKSWIQSQHGDNQEEGKM